MGAYETDRKIAGAAVLENVLQAQPAVSDDPKKSGKLALCRAKNSGPQSI
jgi:hypothetical protein